MTAVRVSEPRHTSENGKLTVSFEVDCGERRYPVWYRISPGPVATSSEVSLATSLLPAMTLGGPLHIAGQVSPKLLSSAETIQDIYSRWFTNQRVAVHATPSPARSAGSAKRGVGCFFSTGVDSFYSLLKHRETVTTLICARGFDIRLWPNWDPIWNQVIEAVRAIAAELKMQVIEVETNVKDFSDDYVQWGSQYQGSVLAAIAQLVSPQLDTIIIPSTHDYGHMNPFGSHPLVDPLWSTEEITCIHDGCEARRVDKVAMLGSSELAMRHMRVCWENRNGRYNCGRCEKCLRTLINLRVTGNAERCRAFEEPLDMATVRRIPIPSESRRAFVEENYRYALRQGADRELIDSLRDALDGVYYRGVLGWPRRAAGLLRRGTR